MTLSRADMRKIQAMMAVQMAAQVQEVARHRVKRHMKKMLLHRVGWMGLAIIIGIGAHYLIEDTQLKEALQSAELVVAAFLDQVFKRFTEDEV